MLDWFVQLLTGYRPAVFSQGDFQFIPSTGAYVAAGIGLAAACLIVLAYRFRRARARPRDVAVLTAIRLALLALLVLCLFRPVLVVKAAVAQQNVVGVLLDDSRSMQIADESGGARSEYVKEQFASPQAPIASALADRFLVRTFRFSSRPERLEAGGDLRSDGGQSRLGAALDGVREELAGLPVAGLVLVTDGADTTESALADSLLALRSAGIPVSTVGVGQEALPRDVQIGRVTMPRTALKGSTLMLDVLLSSTGLTGEPVTVEVEDEGRLVASQQVKLGSDGTPTLARLRVTAAEAGPRVFTFKVAPKPGEVVVQNNTREALLDVRDRQEKILYFEGEPRWELGFLRRAVRDDQQLQVVALQRTADNKYLRLGVDNSEELVGGFPRTRDELFAYRGVVLGSVEAGAFSGDQLQMLAEFVDRRGGGLLMLGGSRAFAEGGYGGTSVADVLPVSLPASRPSAALTRLKVRPTRAGTADAITQVADTEAASTAQWDTMPGVTSVNDVREIKAGATVLLSGVDEARRERPVLVTQRFGRGRAMAFTVQDSWLWQLHSSVAVEDMTHEHYWRQLLRSLVEGVPDPVSVRTLTERVDPGEAATLVADVVDPSFVELNDATVVARVTEPDGNESELPLQWTGERSGEYRATLPTDAPGWYEASVEVTRGGTSVGRGVAHVRAAPSDTEFFDAGLRSGTLRRIAEDTGGRFYTPATAAGLAEDLRYTGRGVTTTEERDLWHMPVVLVVLIALLCAEWAYRRKVGLA